MNKCDACATIRELSLEDFRHHFFALLYPIPDNHLMARKSWIDPDTNEPLIDDYARKLNNFVQAFSDGVISQQEISDQEARLVELMKDVEDDLDDATHAKVTRMLCELTAYDIMQFVFEMQQSRATMFRG